MNICGIHKMRLVVGFLSVKSVLTFLCGCGSDIHEETRTAKLFALSDKVRYHDLHIGGFVMRHLEIAHLRASPPTFS